MSTLKIQYSENGLCLYASRAGLTRFRQRKIAKSIGIFLAAKLGFNEARVQMLKPAFNRDDRLLRGAGGAGLFKNRTNDPGRELSEEVF